MRAIALDLLNIYDFAGCKHQQYLLGKCETSWQKGWVDVIWSCCIPFENELCLLGFNPHKTELMFVLYANNYSFRDFSLGNCNRPQNSNLIHDLVRFGCDWIFFPAICIRKCVYLISLVVNYTCILLDLQMEFVPVSITIERNSNYEIVKVLWKLMLESAKHRYFVIYTPVLNQLVECTRVRLPFLIIAWNINFK